MSGANSTTSLSALRKPGALGSLAAVLLAMAVLWIISLIDQAQESHAAAMLLLPALLLVAGAFAGQLAQVVRLPRLTGYIIMGMLCGPGVLHLIDHDQVKLIKGVNDLAIGLIALMAGAEIQLSWLRKRLKMVLACSAGMSIATPLAILALVLLAPGIFPFMEGLAEQTDALLVPGLLIGFSILATSPMVVVSVIKESKSAGPLTEMAMGLAVFKDIVVLLGFTLLLSMTEGILTSGGETEGGALVSVGLQSLFHVGISVAVGLPIGWVLAFLSEREYTRFTWLLVGASLGVSLLAPILHLEPLFCLLTAGFACENMYRKRTEWGRHHLERSLSQVAAPVFVIFFVAAGLGLDPGLIAAAWLAVILLTVTRIGSYWLGLQAGCRLSGVEPVAQRWLIFGVIPQAGVTLGLAAIIGATFPGWGEQLRDVLIACVALHELIGPVLWTWALKRTGEAGMAGEAPPAGGGNTAAAKPAGGEAPT